MTYTAKLRFPLVVVILLYLAGGGNFGLAQGNVPQL